jgi:hypothetical protein
MDMKFEGWKTNGEWTPQVQDLLESGWIGVGYTMVNQHNARKRAAYATDSVAERQAFEAWVRDRVREGYLPLLRYYIAKSPCSIVDSKFGGPVVLRHSSSGYEVIVESVMGVEVGGIPKSLCELADSTDELDSLYERLRLEDTCAEFALLAEMKGLGAKVIFGNVTGPGPESPMPSGPQPVSVGRKIGRNEPCPCGSGNKYKRCCGCGNPFFPRGGRGDVDTRKPVQRGMSTQLASEIIKEDGLTEPHVILRVNERGYDLVPLSDALEWIDNILLTPTTFHGLNAISLAPNGALTNHLRKLKLGDIVHFEILPNGNIRSYQDVPSEFVRQAIKTLLTFNLSDGVTDEPAN